jgi:LAS superfamily LD-carboxypeptidase LdcB
MVQAASRDRVHLTGWGWRSIESQIALRIQNCGNSDYAIWHMPSSQCNPPTARPGRSMHERGLAIDFSNCSSRSTACWRWLNEHAASYHLFNLPSEPWHWSWNGN